MIRRALALLVAGALSAGQPVLAITAKVSDFSGELAFRLGEGEWADAAKGQELKPEMELCTGPGSEATIGFSDGSAVKLKEMSQLRVGELLSAENRVKVEMLLRSGQMEAQVNPKKVAGTDFSVTTPNATASVKGTKLSISYTPQTGTFTQTLTGSVLVSTESGETTANGGDSSKIDSENELQTSQDLTKSDSSLVVGSTEQVAEENTIIQQTNAPQVSTNLIIGDPSTTDVPASGSAGGGEAAELLLRFVIE
jgi:hypothetical protein